MKKTISKFAKILLLIAMIFSDMMTPISVLAEELSQTPVKGDIRLNGEISKTGSVTVTEGTLVNGGDVQVTKTVSKTDTLGKYKVEFEIKGKNRQDVIEVTKPLYIVVVLDKSGSMICDSSKGSYAYDNYESAYNAGKESNNRFDHNQPPQAGPNFEHVKPASYTAADGTTIYCSNASEDSSYILSSKWENAVKGAVDFSSSLNGIENTYISVVTYASEATDATDFAHKTLTASEFGHPVGATNLKAGIEKAQTKLNSITDTNAQKYILVIGDGEPTEPSGFGQNPTTLAETAATNAKNDGTKIFSIGYGIDEGSEAENVLKAISSNTDTDTSYYQLASIDGLTTSLNTIFNELGDLKKAGTNATLTDNVGSAFSIVGKEGQVYTSETITEITETGTKLSFFIEIDQDSETGWYKTNEGFNLVYTDSNGVSKTIPSDKNPEVYWEQNTYKYIVNYYHDEITSANKIASEERYAVNNTVIDINNVDKDKYLSSYEGYEFNSLTPSSITVTNDGQVKEINVLYTKKKFSYIVNYYYDEVIDKTITETNVPYNTQVDSKDYYLPSDEVKEGYILDTSKSDNSTFTIEDNSVVIDIYYKKNSYQYEVNYYFNNAFDSTKSYNALFGSSISASDHYLTDTELKNKNKEEYFIDPTNSSNTEVIAIKTSNNKLDIYYINTQFTNEKIDKDTITNQITSSNTKIEYTIDYRIDISNIKAGSVITTTIVDTLPNYEIDSIELNGGVYDSTKNTITWTITDTVEDFTTVKIITKEIKYSVIYKNYAQISATDNNVLTNKVNANTKVNQVVSNGVEDTKNIPVNIEGKLDVIYKTTDGTVLEKLPTQTQLVGTKYTTTQKNFYGYTFEKSKGSTSGEYIEGTITVEYIYSKNEGTITKNEVTKTGLEKVTSINDTFEYTLEYEGVIEDYTGDVTLTLTDVLPNKVKQFVSKDDRCTFDSVTNTLTCTETYKITKEKTQISDTFNIAVKYDNILTSEVVNEVTSKLVYGNSNITDDDDTKTEVATGEVIVHYVMKLEDKYIPLNIFATDEEGNILKGFEGIDIEDIILNGMIDSKFETIYKELIGYNFIGLYIGNPVENANYVTLLEGTTTNGTFTEEIQEYTYVYEVETGLGGDVPPKTGVENPTNEMINYLFLLLICLILKKRI